MFFSLTPSSIKALKYLILGDVATSKSFITYPCCSLPSSSKKMKNYDQNVDFSVFFLRDNGLWFLPADKFLLWNIGLLFENNRRNTKSPWKVPFSNISNLSQSSAFTCKGKRLDLYNLCREPCLLIRVQNRLRGMQPLRIDL